MTRSDYLALFEDISEAIEFEHQVLNIGDEFLPDVAIQVRDGGIDEPPSEYWQFLAEQLE